MTRIALSSALCVLCAGCIPHGPTKDETARRLSPNGAVVSVEVAHTNRRANFSGELLEAADSAILIFQEGVWLVPYDGIRVLRLNGRRVEVPRSTRSRKRQQSLVADLRRASRYPYGMPPTVLAELLRQFRQSGPRRVGT